MIVPRLCASPNEIVEDVVQNHEDEDVRRALWQRWLAESRTYSYTIPSKTRNGERMCNCIVPELCLT